MKTSIKNHFIWLAVIILLCNIILHPLVIGNADTTYVSPDGNIYLVNLNNVWFDATHVHIGNHSSNGGCYTQTVYHEHRTSGSKTYTFGDGTSYTEGACAYHEGDYSRIIGGTNITTTTCNKWEHKRPNPTYGQPGHEEEGPYLECGGTLTEQTFYHRCDNCGREWDSTVHNCHRAGVWETFSGKCGCTKTEWDCGKGIIGYYRNCAKDTTTVVGRCNCRLNEDTGKMEYRLDSSNVKPGTSVKYVVKEMTMDEQLLNTYTLYGSGSDNLATLDINQPKYHVDVTFTELEGSTNTTINMPTYIASIFNIRYQNESQKPLNVYLNGTKLRAVYYCNDNNLPEMFNRNRDYLMFGY